MKIFSLICALLVLGCGAAEFYGWGGDGDAPQTLISAIPAFFGAAMLLGTLLAIFFRRTGLQIAFLSALMGGFAGLGRLAPPYVKETLEWEVYPNPLTAGMSVVCLVYVLVAAFCFLFVRSKPPKTGLIGDPDVVRDENGRDDEIVEKEQEKEQEKDQESAALPVS